MKDVLSCFKHYATLQKGDLFPRHEGMIVTFRCAFAWLLASALMLCAPIAVAAAFDDALDDWLADNDYRALPALAKLARGGDTNAQLLLGVIATRPHSPFVANLHRTERRDILRAPGGLSGKSWLHVASDLGNARARALIGVQAPPFQASAIAALVQLGEDGAAANAMLRAATYRRTDPNAAIFDLELSADMAYASTVLKLSASFQQRRLGWRQGDDPLALVEVLAAGAFNAQRPASGWSRDLSLRLFPGDYRGTDAVAAGEFLLSIAPVSRPANRLRAFCTAACPKEVAKCAGDTVALLHGYDQIWRFGPPINALLTEDRFLASPRFHADMARHMKALMARWPLSRQSEWSRKSCAAASRFRSKFP